MHGFVCSSGAVVLCWLLTLASVGLADDPPLNAARGVDRIRISTGGMGLYRPEGWGVLKVGLTNLQDREVELVTSTHFVGHDSLQYGRRLWMPPMSRTSVWHPVRMPVLEADNQKFFESQTLVYSTEGGTETLATDEVGAQKFDHSFRVAHDIPVTAFISQPEPEPADDRIWATTTDFILTARYDRNLFLNWVAFTDPQLPAEEVLLDVLDHLIVADDRLVNDQAGAAAVRRWVAGGGNLWIVGDQVSPELISVLLGDEASLTVVDRVGLTHVDVVRPNNLRQEAAFSRDLDRPAEHVRVLHENVEVAYEVNGWPAAVWKKYGQGQILVTLLSGDGWVRDRFQTASDGSSSRRSISGEDPIYQTNFLPCDPLVELSTRFFVPRALPLIPTAVAEEQVQQLIGYRIPGRATIVGVLLAFTALLPLLASRFSKQGSLEKLGLAVPLVAVLVSGGLLFLGMKGRADVPATTAIVQFVQAVPGTDEIWTTGQAGQFSSTGEPMKLAGSGGGWMVPASAGAQGGNQRIIWSDLDEWAWEGLPEIPGLRTVAFHASGRSGQSVTASAIPDAQGLTGRITLPPNLEPTDAIIDTGVGRLGVEIAADGSFVANQVLGATQYLSADVLSDQQQQRQSILSQILKRDIEKAHSSQATLIVWTRPWAAGLSTVEADTVGSALVTMPLYYGRPAAGTLVHIPSPLLPLHEVIGPDGESPNGLFNVRKGEWIERTGATSTWFGFDLPKALLPLEIESAEVTFKVRGPVGKLVLSTFEEGRVAVRKTWDAPVGTLQHTLTTADHLALDPQGRFLMKIQAGLEEPEVDPKLNKPKDREPRPDPSNGGKKKDKPLANPKSYWQFEEVSVQLKARVPAPPAPSPAQASQ